MTFENSPQKHNHGSRRVKGRSTFFCKIISAILLFAVPLVLLKVLLSDNKSFLLISMHSYPPSIVITTLKTLLMTVPEYFAVSWQIPLCMLVLPH